jgi:hypothetical protein
MPEKKTMNPLLRENNVLLYRDKETKTIVCVFCHRHSHIAWWTHCMYRDVCVPTGNYFDNTTCIPIATTYSCGAGVAKAPYLEYGDEAYSALIAILAPKNSCVGCISGASISIYNIKTY